MDTSSLTTYQAGAIQANFNRKLQKRCDEILAPYEITKMQWLVIGAVLDEGTRGIRISELAEQLGTSMPYLTTAINLLETKGILERKSSSEDSRSKRVVMSGHYKNTCRKIEDALRNGLRETIYARVDPKEFRTYLKVMYQLSAE